MKIKIIVICAILALALCGRPAAAQDAGAPAETAPSISVPPPGIPLAAPATKPAETPETNAGQDEAPATDSPGSGETMRNVLVLPVLNSAFQGKDKFYGQEIDLSLGLQQFLCYALEVLSDHTRVKRISPDVLYQQYPPASVLPGSGETLAARIDPQALQTAARENQADVVLVAEVTKASVLVKDLQWTMEVEVRALAADPSGAVLWEDTFTNREVYEYSGDKQKNAAGSGSILTFSGRKTTAQEIAGNPVIFGGTVNGFPFISVARRIAARF